MLKMFPDVFVSLCLIVFILVIEILAQTPKKFNDTIQEQGKFKMKIKTVRVDNEGIVEQVSKKQDSNSLDAKHYNNETAEESEDSNEENPSAILDEILQYSDIISESLEDYNETPVSLHNDTEIKYNRNVSKFIAIKKSKAKENDDDSSEIDSVEEGSENKDIVTSTENYESVITKSLLPNINLPVTHNASKKFHLENKEMLPNKQRLKEVNLYAPHKPKSSKELALRNNKINTKILNNNTMKENSLKTFYYSTKGGRNITNTERPRFHVTPTKYLKISDLTKISLNKSKNFEKQKNSLNKNQILNKVRVAHFDDHRKKVGHESFSNKTISKNVKNTFNPSKLAKNSTILNKLVHIVNELNNILSISSEIDTKSDNKIINEIKSYQLTPEKKAGVSSKPTNISYFNYIRKTNKPTQSYKIKNGGKQNRLIKSRTKSKIRGNVKKKSQTKQKYKNPKVTQSVKLSKVANTTTTYKTNSNQSHTKEVKENNNTITAQELKESNRYTDDEEIKTPNDKTLNRALQTFDKYEKALNSNKIKDIIDEKTKFNADKADAADELYEDYDRRLGSKSLRKSNQKVNKMESNRGDNNSEVTENCGVSDSNFTIDQEQTSIENLPWLGVLCYREKDVSLQYHPPETNVYDLLSVANDPANYRTSPLLLCWGLGKNMRRFTNVILVTKNMVIASALDIYKIPKADFRQRSKVVLGRPCNYRPGFRVLEYSYHPEYGKTTYSSIALIQLDVAKEKVLHPICINPTKLIKPQFHTFVLPYMCKQTSVNIYRMNLLDLTLCKSYYDGIGLSTTSVWPKKSLCGIALHHGGCIWRNGVALVVKQQNKWHLMGFGVNGPGCGAPSRFVDFSVYAGWVAGSVARVGRPALTRLADNHLVLRRSNGVIGRHGPCDPFEKQTILYTNRYETTKFDNQDSVKKSGVFRYNITLHPNYDYSCIEMIASSKYKAPLITMRSYNANETANNQIGFINYSLKVYFSNALDIQYYCLWQKNWRAH